MSYLIRIIFVVCRLNFTWNELRYQARRRHASWKTVTHVIFPFKEHFTEEQEMFTSSMTKRCWRCVRDGPALQSVTPSQPPSNFTEVVFWILHDELNCLVISTLVWHWVFTEEELSTCWTVSLLSFNENNCCTFAVSAIHKSQIETQLLSATAF